MIDERIRHHLKLDPGEKLLWAGRPKSLYIRRTAIIYFLIVGPFCYWLYTGIAESSPEELDGFTIFIALLLLNGLLAFLSPMVERHYLTNRRIVADFPLFRSTLYIGHSSKVRIADWAGNNCLLVTNTHNSRSWFHFSIGIKGVVLHGLQNPNAFIQKFEEVT